MNLISVLASNNYAYRQVVPRNCNLFAFHKSNSGYDPEDMDIVLSILSNIFSIKIKHSVKTKHKNSIHNLLVKVNMLKPSKQLKHSNTF